MTVSLTLKEPPGIKSTPLGTTVSGGIVETFGAMVPDATPPKVAPAVLFIIVHV